jgi:uncharacterized membrane protein YjjB (DUF3815 family)
MRPVIIFIVPGIIPLVPGGTAYEATRYLVSNDYTQAVNTFLEVTALYVCKYSRGFLLLKCRMRLNQK